MSRLYPCVYCTEDGFCKKYSDEEVTSWCVQGPCKDEKPSNADRIRAMTDEELAYLFVDIAECTTRCMAHRDGCALSDSTCHDAWLCWLKQEGET